MWIPPLTRKSNEFDSTNLPHVTLGENSKVKRLILISMLLLIPSSVVLAQHVVFPGTLKISLGTYTDWNSQAEVSTICINNPHIVCKLDSDEYRVVGDTTSSASTADELKTLTQSFGFECLDKAARFADVGQYVYPDVGYYQGPLHQHFESEANRCWDHYDDIYQDNKDDY